MNEIDEQTKSLLQKYGQEHLLQKYTEMTEQDKTKLLQQIKAIDFEQIQKLYEKTKEKALDNHDKIEPISFIDKDKMTVEEKERRIKIGEEKIKNGKLAYVTMAGGQGTRLGHVGPKGTFELINGKTLFELICDTLKQANERYRISIPWYIMTSRENNDDTVKFFEEKNYLGYNKEDISFFKQGELPMISVEGKILLDEKGFVKEAADGHGGTFESIVKNHMLEDMKKRNIEWVFISGIDNPLVKMVDPLFIGLAEENHVLAAGKSLVKTCPEEKVGVFCKRNGRPSVIEYTEISSQMAEQRDEQGELSYGEAHILTNMFHIKALEQIGENKLPYHSAFKKAEYLDENGNVIKPESPNAYKFESFIFDAFEMLDNMTIMRVKREEEFAPVKNATGVDSPETARLLYLNYRVQEQGRNN